MQYEHCLQCGNRTFNGANHFCSPPIINTVGVNNMIDYLSAHQYCGCCKTVIPFGTSHSCSKPIKNTVGGDTSYQLRECYYCGGIFSLSNFVSHMIEHHPDKNIDQGGLGREVVNPNALRYNKDKIDYTQIPIEVSEALAKVLMFGAEKYGRDNFKKLWGADTVNVCLASAYRHMAAIQKGEDLDPESGLPHAACAAANLGFLIWALANNKTIR